MSVNEYFKSVKTTVYQSVLTRRMLYNLLSLLVMLTYFASNAEGSFSSEVFKLVAEGNCRFMCILKFPLLLLPFNLRYLWRLNYWFLGPCHRCISIKFFNHQQRKGLKKQRKGLHVALPACIFFLISNIHLKTHKMVPAFYSLLACWLLGRSRWTRCGLLMFGNA